MPIKEISSVTGWVEYSDGDKVEHFELAFKIPNQQLLKYDLTLNEIQECIEKLFLLKQINSKNKVYLKYKTILDECSFDGRVKEIDLDFLPKLIFYEIDEAIHIEYEKLKNKNIYIQNRVPWETSEQVSITCYRRVGIAIKSKNINPI